MMVDHRFERVMSYAWGGYRFVCSCGQSGPVVDTISAAEAEHGRHAEKDALRVLYAVACAEGDSYLRVPQWGDVGPTDTSTRPFVVRYLAHLQAAGYRPSEIELEVLGAEPDAGEEA